MRGLLITGTDTDVGKTYVTSLIARELLGNGRNVGICKPVCSGAEFRADGSPFWNDVETHFHALRGTFPRELICPTCFEEPLAPPVAAARVGQSLTLGRCLDAIDAWRGRVDLLLVEGVGGFLCPLTETKTIADLACELQLPILIVARRGLGTLNHTLLTIESICARGLQPAGIVLNQSLSARDMLATTTNEHELSRRTDVPILSVVEYQQTDRLRPVSPASTIEWFSLAGPLM